MCHWIRSALVQIIVAYSAPSHYLNQCWVFVNWTLRNKLQWNFNQDTKLFIHENASEYIVCEMVAILTRRRWVEGREWVNNNMPLVYIDLISDPFPSPDASRAPISDTRYMERIKLCRFLYIHICRLCNQIPGHTNEYDWCGHSWIDDNANSYIN